MVRRKNFFFLVIAALLVTCTFVARQFWSGPPDPVIHGERLSAHLVNAYDPYPFASPADPRAMRAWQKRDEQAGNSSWALGKYGVHALPLLTDWLGSPEKMRLGRLEGLTQKLGWRTAAITLDRRVAACKALRDHPEFAEVAGNLIPLVTPYLTNRNSELRRSAIEAMAHLLIYTKPEDPEKIAATARANISSFAVINLPGTNELWSGLGSGSEPLLVLPFIGEELRAFFILQRGTVTNRVAAAQRLAAGRTRSECVVPILTQGLNRSDLAAAYAEALSAYGREAIAALPALASLQTNSVPAIREAASKAMGLIETGGASGQEAE